MKWRSSQPTLVTLEGEFPEPAMTFEEIERFLGIEYEDAELLGSGAFTYADLDYLNRKYPELMGAWPAILAKIGGAVASGVKGIVRAVKRRRAKRKKKSSSQPSAVQQAQQRLIAMQIQQAQARKVQQDRTKKILMIGIPAGIGLILLMTMMNKPAPQRTIVERRPA